MEGKKENLLILGAGQYGRVAEETALAMGCFGKVDFLDDRNPLAVGKMDAYAALLGQYRCAFVALGDPVLRGRYIAVLRDTGWQLATLVHPRATVLPSAKLGGGVIAEAGVVVSSCAEVAEGCILSAGAVLNHNCTVGPMCHIDCNATVPAGAAVPPCTKVPCGTVFQNQEDHRNVR